MVVALVGPIMLFTFRLLAKAVPIGIVWLRGSISFFRECLLVPPTPLLAPCAVSTGLFEWKPVAVPLKLIGEMVSLSVRALLFLLLIK